MMLDEAIARFSLFLKTKGAAELTLQGESFAQGGRRCNYAEQVVPLFGLIMSNSSVACLSKHLENLTAPRAEHSIDHLLIDMVIITICAVICGTNNWVEIENYGHAKKIG